MSDPTSPALAALIDEPAVLAQQRGFAKLRFSRALEPGFMLYLHGKMSSRVGLVAFSTISFMLFFMWVDVMFLPAEINRYTVTIRAVVLCIVAFTLWLCSQPGRISPSAAFLLGTCGYVAVGLMVVLVIGASRLITVPTPVTHDGLYLVLLSGFFLLGLRHSVAA
jgi:uncharacterized membrane protein